MLFCSIRTPSLVQNEKRRRIAMQDQSCIESKKGIIHITALEFEAGKYRDLKIFITI